MTAESVSVPPGKRAVPDTVSDTGESVNHWSVER